MSKPLLGLPVKSRDNLAASQAHTTKHGEGGDQSMLKCLYWAGSQDNYGDI